MKYSLAIAVIISASGLSRGDGLVYSDSDLHYSFKLPQGWRSLPPAFLEHAADAFSQFAIRRPQYQAWLQRADKPDGAYPYILLSRQICLMPTLKELAADLRESNKLGEEKANNALRTVASDTKILDPVVDSLRKLVFFEMEQTVRLDNIGKVRGKCYVFPGKLGIAQLHFHATPDEMERSKSDFDSVLDSFAFEPGYDYESGLLADVRPRGIDLDRSLVFGLICGLLGALCYRLSKWRNPTLSPRLLRLRFIFIMLIIMSGLELLINPITGPAGSLLVLGSFGVGTAGLAASWMFGKGPVSSVID